MTAVYITCCVILSFWVYFTLWPYVHTKYTNGKVKHIIKRLADEETDPEARDRLLQTYADLDEYDKSIKL